MELVLPSPKSQFQVFGLLLDSSEKITSPEQFELKVKDATGGTVGTWHAVGKSKASVWSVRLFVLPWLALNPRPLAAKTCQIKH